MKITQEDESKIIKILNERKLSQESIDKFLPEFIEIYNGVTDENKHIINYLFDECYQYSEIIDFFPKLDLLYRVPENRKLLHNVMNSSELRFAIEHKEKLFNELFTIPEYKEALLFLTDDIWTHDLQHIMTHISYFVELCKIPEDKEILYKVVKINRTRIVNILEYFPKIMKIYRESNYSKKKVINKFLSYDRGIFKIIHNPELIELYNLPKNFKIINKLFESDSLYYIEYLSILSEFYYNPENEEIIDKLIDKGLLLDNVISYLPNLIELYVEHEYNKEIIDLLIDSLVIGNQCEILERIDEFIPKLIDEYFYDKDYVVDLFTTTFKKEPMEILQALKIVYRFL